MNLTKHKFYPWLLVICYSIMGIFFPAAVTQYSMVVDNLAEALNVSNSVVLLADTVRAVCLFSAMFLSGYSYRHLGLRKTLAIGISCQIIPQFLIPMAVNAGSLPLLFVLKGMQGFNAIAFPLYISTITMWMDEKYDAVATSIFNGSFTAGSGIGAFIAGKIIPLFGWQGSFYIIGVTCAVTAIPVLLVTRDRKYTPNHNLKTAATGDICKESSSTSRKNKKGVYANIINQPITWFLILSLFANTWVTQAVTVDMSVYSNSIFDIGQTGNLMLAVSFVTVISSILGGAVSDFAASRTRKKIRTRSAIMILGYILSAIAAVFIPISAGKSFIALSLAVCLMMFGASWAGGVFWSLPVLCYKKEDNVAGTSFCSAASNVPNPIAPMVVGVLLGSNGHWSAAWMTCAIASIISFFAGIFLTNRKRS